MRWLLILLGLIVAASIGLVLAWPRMVDEPRLRAEMARLLQEAGGPRLQVQGAIRLELLPLPRITVDRVVLGDRAAMGGAPDFEADRVDLEIAPLALLAGRIEPSRLQLVRPQIDIADGAVAAGEALLRGLSGGALAGLQRIDIVDGTIRQDAASGWPDPIAAIDLTATRSEDATFRVEASAAVAGDPLRLVLAGAPLAVGVPVSLTMEMRSGPRDSPAELDFRGSMVPGQDGTRLDGALRVDAQRRPLPAWVDDTLGWGGVVWPNLPWALQGRLSVTQGLVGLTDAEISLPGGRLRGTVAVDFGPAPAFDLSLDGSQLELTPELLRAVQDLGSGSRLPEPWTGRAQLRLADLVWRNDRVRGLQAEMEWPRGRGPDLRQLEANLPGASSLRWVGTGRGTNELPLAGKIDLQSGELRRLLTWLGAVPDDLPQGGLTSLDMSAAAGIGPGRFRLDDLRVRLDATELTGSVTYAADTRPRLDVVLAADRLNVALYADTAPARTAWSKWRDRLQSLDGRIDLTVDRLSHDVLRGRGFRLLAGLETGQLSLEELHLADLGGASLELRGALDLRQGRYGLAVDARLSEAKPFLRLLHVEPPAEIERLAPLRLTGDMRGGAETAQLDLKLSGQRASASLSGTLGTELDGKQIDLAATVAASDAADLLQALGWPGPPDRSALGAVDAQVGIRRQSGPLELSGRGRVGRSELDGRVSIAMGAERPLVEGALHAAMLDTGLLAAAYETLAIPLAFPPGRPWLWPGDWPSQPLRWEWLKAVDLKIALDAAALRHRAAELPGAGMEVTLEAGTLTLSRITVPIAGGELKGTVTLGPAPGYVILGTDLRLEGARAEQLAAALAPGSGFSGTMDVAAELAAEGQSVAGLVASLRGNGELAIRAGRVSGLELGQAAEARGSAGTELSTQGPFNVSQGILTSAASGMTLELGMTEARLDLKLDLLTWILDAQLAAALPGSRETTGIIRLFGPPGRVVPVPTAPAP